MNFADDNETWINTSIVTVDSNYDVVTVQFQMRSTELEAIATGTEADKDALIAWLTPAPEPE